MSIYKDGKLIAGGRQTMPLLSFMWADHQLNDVSWLRADTFSWQSGAVYQAAYQHLVDDISGKPLISETISGVTVQFCLADDGHKVCPASEESNVAAIYTATGVAWYYILDTTNQRFKLPRSSHNKYANILPVVGNGMALGITNGQTSRAIGATTVHDSKTTTALMVSNNDPINMTVGTSVGISTSGGNNLGTGIAYGVSTSANRSGLIAQQEQDTEQYKYLYFYVGQFTQTALENTAGITTEEMNNKADKNDAVGYCSFNTGTRVQITSSNQTAAKNGWLLGFFAYTGNNAAGKIYVNDIEVSRGSTSTSTQWGNVSVQIPVKAGQTYSYGLDSGATMQNNSMYFYPND